MNYSDAKLNHDRYLMADPDVFNECPDWKADFYNQTAEDGASYISITGNDPNLMKDINPSYRILEMRQARLKQDKYRKKLRLERQHGLLFHLLIRIGPNPFFQISKKVRQ